MKYGIVYDIFKKLKQDPKLMRKFKIFALVSFAGFFVLLGLGIWAASSLFQVAMQTGQQIIQSPVTQNQISNLESEIKNIEFQPLSCWQKTQSLMAVEPWLASSLADNLQSLKAACLSAGTKMENKECTTSDCESLNNDNEQAGGFI